MNETTNLVLWLASDVQFLLGDSAAITRGSVLVTDSEYSYTENQMPVTVAVEEIADVLTALDATLAIVDLSPPLIASHSSDGLVVIEIRDDELILLAPSSDLRMLNQNSPMVLTSTVETAPLALTS